MHSYTVHDRFSTLVWQPSLSLSLCGLTSRVLMQPKWRHHVRSLCELSFRLTAGTEHWCVASMQAAAREERCRDAAGCTQDRRMVAHCRTGRVDSLAGGASVDNARPRVRLAQAGGSLQWQSFRSLGALGSIAARKRHDGGQAPARRSGQPLWQPRCRSRSSVGVGVRE